MAALQYLVLLGPLALMATIAFFVLLPSVAWAPFAAVITWRLARRQGLEGRRYALMGAVSSIFMLLHWPLLLVTLIRGRVPVRTTRLCYVLLHSAWLFGPIMFWGQFFAQFEFVMTLGIMGGPLSEDLEPPLPLLSYCGFALMVVAWLASVTMTWRMWPSIPGAGAEDVVSRRYILPFALAWLCAIITLLYLWLGPK